MTIRRSDYAYASRGNERRSDYTSGEPNLWNLKFPEGSPLLRKREVSRDTIRRSVLMSDGQLNGILEQFFDEFEDVSLLHKSIITEQGLTIAEANNQGKYGYVLIEQRDKKMTNYKEEFEHRKEICVNDNNFIIREIIDYDYKFAYFSWRKNG